MEIALALPSTKVGNLTWIEKFLSREAKRFLSDFEVDRRALVLAVLRHRRDEMPDDVIVNPPSVTVQLVA